MQREKSKLNKAIDIIDKKKKKKKRKTQRRRKKKTFIRFFWSTVFHFFSLNFSKIIFVYMVV